MYLRIRYKKLGGHYHCRVFIGQSKVHTLANAGSLTFNEREWPLVSDVLRTIAEVMEDE